MPANLHVRNVPDEIVARLNQRAAENGRSPEAEHRAALEQAFGGVAKAEWLAKAAESRKRIQAHVEDRELTPSEALILGDRDSR